MKNIIFSILLIVVLTSCNTNQIPENTTISSSDKTMNNLFYDSALNQEFKKFLDYTRQSYEGDKIHLISFESDGFVQFTDQLCVDKENLIGHIDYKEDVILVYDFKEIAGKYLNVDLLKTDSITKFPYFEDVDNLPPFDPPSAEFTLTNYKSRFDNPRTSE